MSYNGFINVLKPPGMSSAAVVGVVKRLTGERRVGHAGTLDPEAAGVLPVMVGRATRLFDLLADKEKTYVAECAFGCATDTDDAAGRVIATGENVPTLAEVAAVLPRFTGDIAQRASVYSALKQDGKPLYARARAGEAVEAPVRTVHIDRITLLAETANHGILMRVDCGRGTYIRALCRDLGEALACPAHMRFLERTRTGPFTIDNAYTVEALTAARDAGTLPACLLPPDWPIGHLPALRVKAAYSRLARNGAALLRSQVQADGDVPEGEPLRVYDGEDFLGIAQVQDGQLHWRAVLVEQG